MNIEYPKLNKIARKVANKTLRDIVKSTRNVKSKMPYKNQYVLEIVIQLLKERV